VILYFIAFCIWLFLIYQFANFSHSSVSLFADHNSKIFGIYNISLKQKEETPQALPRSQASQVSATRSLYLSYLNQPMLSRDFYSYYSIFCFSHHDTLILILSPFVHTIPVEKLYQIQRNDTKRLQVLK